MDLDEFRALIRDSELEAMAFNNRSMDYGDYSKPKDPVAKARLYGAIKAVIDESSRLRAEVEALKAENAALASWQCLFTDGTTGLYHDGCGNAQCARDHLVVHLTAEVEALRADAERWRYINTRNNVWRRHNTAGEEHSALCVILPYGADLSCRATREIAIDAARAAQGGQT